MLILIIGLVLFLGIHSSKMLFPGFRGNVIASRGLNAWKGIYSLVSFAGLILIIWGYALYRPDAPDLWIPPVWTRHIALLLMAFAFIILVSSNLPTGRIKQAVKHPMLLSVKIWALAHLLANGDLASIILFGSFLAWAVWDRIAAKRRGDPLPVAGSSLIPDVLSVVIGLALYVVFVLWAHQWLFGVAPVVM
ncbi:MAG: NnrU family protein [Nitratireductor sp.]|nr:NnrU family protein [Nitratireductor sp.]MCC0020660.1 NnrU family protein [Nitratireductor sp.]